MREKPLNGSPLSLLFAAVMITNGQATQCNMSNSAAAFGAYGSTSSAEIAAIGSVSLTCNGSVQVMLSLNVGSGSGASFSGGRKMTRSGSGETLMYQLYADSAHSRVLGDATNGSVTLRMSGNRTMRQTIWGIIPGGQPPVRPGIYSDIVVATISY